MPYDYSRQFLLKHRELVQQLQELATSRTARKYPFDTWEELRYQQALVNNLLASIAKNIPGAAGIRKTVGCWVEWSKDNTSLLLWVGSKDNKPTAGVKRSELYIPLEQAATMATGLDRYETPITNKDTMQQFFYRVASAASHVRTMELKIRNPHFTKADGEQFRTILGSMGWMVTNAEDLEHVTIGRLTAPVEQEVKPELPTELDIIAILENPALSQQWQSFTKYLGIQPPSVEQLEVLTNIEVDPAAFEYLNENLFMNVGWQVIGGHDSTFTIQRLKNG